MLMYRDDSYNGDDKEGNDGNGSWVPLGDYMLKRMPKLSLFCLLAILLPWHTLALMQSPIGFTPRAGPSGSWVNIPQPWAMPRVT